MSNTKSFVSARSALGALGLTLCACAASSSDALPAADDVGAKLQALQDVEPEFTVDSDGDGFSDGAERSDVLGVSLPEYGASPDRIDVFVYIDYYEKPSQAAIDLVVDAFGRAPLRNPDRSMGVSLHPILGRQIAEADRNPNMTQLCPDQQNPDPEEDWTAFDAIKDNYFPAQWAKVAHYALIADQIGGEQGVSGCSRGIPAHDFIVSLKTWGEVGQRDMVQAGTLMHELGHNLGLMHDGRENLNFAPNYLSVMNYNYQATGLPMDTGEFVLDYSRFVLGAMTEQSVDESIGIPSGYPHSAQIADFLGGHQVILGYQINDPTKTLAQKVSGTPVAGTGAGWLDFNNNGIEDGAIGPIDLDGNQRTTETFPETWNDWENLAYAGATEGGGLIGDMVEAPDAPVIVQRLTVEDPLFEMGVP